MQQQIICRTRVAALVAVGLLAGCGGGGGAALKMFPDDTAVVGGFDMSKSKGTPLWSAGEDLVKTFAKDDAVKAGLEEVQDKLKKFTKKTGLDPLKDIQTVTWGFTMPEKGDPQGAAIVTGAEFDESKLVDYFEEESKTDLDKDEVKGVKVYKAKDMEFAFLDKKTLIVGSPDFIDAMLELKGGKGKSAAENKELAAALKKVESGAAAYLAGAVTEEMQKSMKAGPVKGLDDAVDFAASLLLAKGVKVVAKIGFEKKEQASDVVEGMEKAAKEYKKSAKDAGEAMPWMKDVVESYTLEAKGNDAVLTVDISEDLLGKMVKWAKKEGKDTLPMMMMGMMGGAMPKPDGGGGGGGGGGLDLGGGGGGIKDGAKLTGHGAEAGSDSIDDLISNVTHGERIKAADEDAFRTELKKLLDDISSGSSSLAKGKKFDVVFIVDSTGCCSTGWVISTLKTMKRDFSPFLDAGNRIGVVSHRDEGDEYVAKTMAGLTSDAGALMDGMDKMNNDGGGDTPEGQYDGIAEAAKMDWDKSSGKVIILMTDAEIHAREPARANAYKFIDEMAPGVAVLWTGI
ncbi:MAG TPA: vWA domain-containing protein [Myxococcota bacterium]|nr:vWA domain-containing protein [Myxococcota bacterium]